MARGYISILTPNVGAAIPPVARTRLVGGNDGSVILSPGMSSGQKEKKPMDKSADKDHYSCGLNPNMAFKKGKKGY